MEKVTEINIPTPLGPFSCLFVLFFSSLLLFFYFFFNLLNSSCPTFQSRSAPVAEVSTRVYRHPKWMDRVAVQEPCS